MLKKLAAAGGDTINLQELGITNMQEMLEDMEENERIMEDLEKPWEQKLAEEKERTSAAAPDSGEANDDNTRDDTINNSATDSGVEPSNNEDTAARILDSPSP